MIIKVKNSWFFFVKNHFLFILLVLMLPFSGTSLLGDNIAGIPGAKPINLIALGVAFSLLFKKTELLTYTDKARLFSTLGFVLYLAIFSIEFLRSAYNINELAFRNPDVFGAMRSSNIRYALSFWFKPIVLTVSFLYLINAVRDENSLKQSFRVLLVSILIFAVFTLMISAPVVFSGLGRSALNTEFSLHLSMHYNTVATILMLGVPLAMSQGLKGNIVWVIGLSVIVVALLFTQSRGAILGALLATIVFLYLQKRVSPSLLIIAIVLGVTGMFAFQYIAPVLTQGIENRDIHQITSGRVSSMWQPILMELFNEPLKLLFGLGLYGVIMTDAYMFDPSFFRATHAHNLYIDFLVDAGLIVFVTFLALFVKGISSLLSAIRQTKNKELCALLCSFFAYLFAGISGRQFFPDTENMMVFPVLGLIVSFYIFVKRIHKI